MTIHTDNRKLRQIARLLRRVARRIEKWAESRPPYEFCCHPGVDAGGTAEEVGKRIGEKIKDTIGHDSSLGYRRVLSQLRLQGRQNLADLADQAVHDLLGRVESEAREASEKLSGRIYYSDIVMQAKLSAAQIRDTAAELEKAMASADTEAPQNRIDSPALPVRGQSSAMINRQEIIVEMHSPENLRFFRDRWNDFCGWAAECGERLHKHQAEQTDEYYEIMEKLSRAKRKSPNLERKAEQARIRAEERAHELQVQGWLPWTDHGRIIPGFTAQMLNLPMRGTFYAPPEVVNPVLWLLGAGTARDPKAMLTVRGGNLWHFSDGRNPRPPGPDYQKEQFLLDCAVLCALNDSQVAPREPHIHTWGAHEAPHFQCDEFYRHLFAELPGMEQRGELQRAWERVKPHLPQSANGPKAEGNGKKAKPKRPPVKKCVKTAMKANPKIHSAQILLPHVNELLKMAGFNNTTPEQVKKKNMSILRNEARGPQTT